MSQFSYINSRLATYKCPRGRLRNVLSASGFALFTLAAALLLLNSGARTANAATYYCGGFPATIVGTEGPDVIFGTEGNDVIVGLGGDDVIFGIGGDNIICGNQGNDRIYGGPGNDIIYGGSGDDLIYGGDGDDVIYGNDGDDVIYGQGGDDIIYGGPGNDRIFGGPGNDTILGGPGDDHLVGDEGDDIIYGGDGNDTILGGPGNDYLHGGPGNDVIWGGDGNDTIFGGEGDDFLHGGEGDDYIRGGPGNDVIHGGPGNDIIFGDDGDDQLYGGPGNDRIYGGAGADLLAGGPGDDFLNGGPGPDEIHGGGGANTIDWYYPDSDTLGHLSTADTVNMNWLSSTVSFGDEFSVAIPIYGDGALLHVRTVLRPLIRSGDMLVLSSGNGEGGVDVHWVNSAAKALRREFPSNEIALLASGMSNMRTARWNIDSVVDTVFYGYEANFPNEPEFTWDFDETVSNVLQASTIVRNGGFEAGAYVTAQPVLQKRKWDWGWGSYGWYYGALRNRSDNLIVQTQGYCADSVSRFEQALDKLGDQVSKSWMPQVTITPGAPNSAPLWRANACANRAKQRKLDGIMVWWSPGHLQDMVSFLKNLGRN